MCVQRFGTHITAGPGGRAEIVVPFDPDQVWGAKAEHPVGGTINGRRIGGGLHRQRRLGVRGDPDVGARRRGPADSDVTVELAPEGPQRGDLADDVAAALEASPAAAAFFDTLAQFYRKAYLRWIDATTRRPGCVRRVSRRWWTCSRLGSTTAATGVATARHPQEPAGIARDPDSIPAGGTPRWCELRRGLRDSRRHDPSHWLPGDARDEVVVGVVMQYGDPFPLGHGGDQQSGQPPARTCRWCPGCPGRRGPPRVRIVGGSHS